jgi:DNA-binding transcriptional ArsR family regulator
MTHQNQNDAPDPNAQDEAGLADAALLRLVSHPLRTRILGLLDDQPRSVHQVADILGVPFTRLYYHFHLLEKNGMIRLADTRHVLGGVDEKFYERVARWLIVSRTDQAGLAQILDEVFGASHRIAQQSVADGTVDPDLPGPDPFGMLIRYGTLRLTPAQAGTFKARLIALIGEYLAAPEEADSRLFQMVAAVFPISTRAEDDPRADAAE